MDAARSSGKLFAANLVVTALGFLGIAYFARELGADQLGVFFLYQAIVELVSVVTNLGLNQSIRKRISEGDDPGRFLTTGILLKTVPLAVAALVILALGGLINDYVGAEVVLYVVIAVPLREFSEMIVQVIEGELRVGETAVIRLSRQFVWVASGVALIQYGLGVEAVIVGTYLGWSVKLGWGMVRRSTGFGRPSLDYAQSLFDFAKFSSIGHVSGYFYSWLDVIVIGYFLPPSAVAAYEVAWRVTEVFTIFSNAIGLSVFPQISRYHAEGDWDAIQDLISRSLMPTVFIVIPAFAGTLLLSREVLRFTFGPEYTIAWLVLVVLAAEKLFQALRHILARSLDGIDRPNLSAFSTGVTLTLNVVLNLLLVPQIGIVGGAVATFVSFVVNALLNVYFVSRHLTIAPAYGQIGRLVVASAVMLLAVAGLRSFLIEVDTLLRLLFVVAAGAGIYAGLTLSNDDIRREILRYVPLPERVTRPAEA